MTDKDELKVYRQFLSRFSIAIATFNSAVIRECLTRIRNWGYAHSNSTMSIEHDEKCRVDSINALNKEILQKKPK